MVLAVEASARCRVEFNSTGRWCSARRRGRRCSPTAPRGWPPPLPPAPSPRTSIPPNRNLGVRRRRRVVQHSRRRWRGRDRGLGCVPPRLAAPKPGVPSRPARGRRRRGPSAPGAPPPAAPPAGLGPAAAATRVPASARPRSRHGVIPEGGQRGGASAARPRGGGGRNSRRPGCLGRPPGPGPWISPRSQPPLAPLAPRCSPSGTTPCGLVVLRGRRGVGAAGGGTPLPDRTPPWRRPVRPSRRAFAVPGGPLCGPPAASAHGVVIRWAAAAAAGGD